MKAKTEYRYNRLTWEEINDAVEMDQLVILPTGATEQHGRHLPIDVDIFLAESVALEIGRRVPEQVLVLPPVSYGLNAHHIDFPGTIHIKPDTFINFCTEILTSVAYHGFSRMLLVNGHGSNMPMVDLVARKVILATNAVCSAVSYFSMAQDVFSDVRDSDIVAHADEFETSIYLHLAPERVIMEKAERCDGLVGKYMSASGQWDYPVRYNGFWSPWTSSGVHGDPTVATAEKGRTLFDTTIERLIDVVAEIRQWPTDPRVDMHRRPPELDVKW